MERLGSYNLLEQLATSGVGDVFRARDTVHGRTVLIRLMPPRIAEDAQLRERLVADARAAAGLSHPNIEALFELGEDGPHLFLVLEFIPGQTLGKVIGGRPLNVRNAIDIAVQLADALAEAQAEGFVHGAIRPEHIRINPKGQAKILEFGLSGWMAAAAGASPAPSPQSPAPDPDLDLAALGAVLYEMLTGRPPSAKPGAPSTLNRDVPCELDAIVLRAISSKRDQRYQSGATFAAELRSVAAILDIRSGDREPPRVAQPAPKPWTKAPAPRPAALGMAFRRGPQRGSRAGAWLAAVVLVAVVAGALWWRAGDMLASVWQRWLGPVPNPVVLVAPIEVAAPQRQYWSRGLAHDLAMRLGQIPGVTVLGRTGAQNAAQSDAARWTLRPQALLTGALEFRDGRVELDMALLNLSDRRSVWTQRYVSEPRAILATQTEIAEAVARALQVALAPSPARARKKAHRVAEGSYELYLRGRDRAASGDTAGALEFYEQAVRDGETFAELDAAYSDALYRALSDGGPADPVRAEARLRAAATRAAAADPDLPQAPLAQAMAATSLQESLAHVRRALELDPSLGAAYQFAAHQLVEIDPARAIRFAERALELDPGSVDAALDLVHAEARLDRFERAERALESARERLPEAIAWPAQLARLRFEQAQYEAGLRGLGDASELGRRPMLAVVTIAARQQAGQPEEARASTAALVAAMPGFCEARAIEVALQIEAGERRAARDAAERLMAEADAANGRPRAVGCAALAAAGIHDNARTAAVLRRIADSDAALRAWLFPVNGISVRTMFRREWYPWSQVARDPEVLQAAAAIDQRIEEWRSSVAGLLDDLLD